VDIDGDPPLPTGSKQFSSNFGNLLFLTVFRVLNFESCLEVLNNVFWQFGEKNKGNIFFPSYRAPQMEIVCQSYAPGKLIHQTTQNGVHKTVGFSFSGVRVLDFRYYKKALRASL